MGRMSDVALALYTQTRLLVEGFGFRVQGFGVTPQLPSIIPQIPTMKDHKVQGLGFGVWGTGLLSNIYETLKPFGSGFRAWGEGSEV